MCRMAYQRLLLSLAVLLLVIESCRAQQYFPSNCDTVCSDPSQFIEPLPRQPAGTESRIAQWSIVGLNQVRPNLGATSPPGVARALGILGTCIYEATTLFDKDLKPYAAYRFKKVGLNSKDDLEIAIDGAAYTALRHIFGEFDSFKEVKEFLHTSEASRTALALFSVFLKRGASWSLIKFMTKTGFKRLNDVLALEAGSMACRSVIAKYTADGYDGLGNPQPGTKPFQFEPANLPQSRAGLTDCENEIKDFNLWQPLCTPRVLGDIGSTDCNVQEFLAPSAGGWTTFAIPRGTPLDGQKLIDDAAVNNPQIIGGPPKIEEGTSYMEQMIEVVNASASLDDPQKLIAEYWADGPDSTFPPGSWFLIAVNAGEERNLDTMRMAQLVMLTGNALNDAGVAAWRIKVTFNSIRPLPMIQCGLGQDGGEVTAWRGNYLGVGSLPADRWQPYQLDTFKTPPFAGYVSGHATFSFASLEVLRKFFGGEEYVGPNCQLFNEGESAFEPRSDAQPGLTDVPNTGINSIGYSPRSDVVLCWESFEDAALQASESRLYGGIHVRADAFDGDIVGLEAGKATFERGQKMFGKFTVKDDQHLKTDKLVGDKVEGSSTIS